MKLHGIGFVRLLDLNNDCHDRIAMMGETREAMIRPMVDRNDDELLRCEGEVRRR